MQEVLYIMTATGFVPYRIFRLELRIWVVFPHINNRMYTKRTKMQVDNIDYSYIKQG